MMSESAHILIVDDQPRGRDLLARELQRHGFVCECRDSGVACLQTIAGKVPDLILLDVLMPTMSGLEVLRELRRSWDADVLPVILVTAKVDSADVVAGFAAGANDYVVKPLNVPELLARIRTSLRIRELSASSARRGELQRVNEALAAEVAERRAANQQLMAYQSKLRALSAQVALAEERERRRIARGLHDEIGQSLALVKMRLGSFDDLANDPETARNLEQIRSAVEKAIVHIRSLTFDLGSRILYEFGLEAAIENLVEEMQKHGVEPFFADDRRPKPLDEEVRVIVFQAVRELLHNISKHAEARHVWVSLARDDGFLRVEVRDDGKGFDPGKAGQAISKTDGFGLFSVREQLDYIGGRVSLESSPARGTRITISAPLAGQEAPVGARRSRLPSGK